MDQLVGGLAVWGGVAIFIAVAWRLYVGFAREEVLQQRKEAQKR